MHAPSVKAGEEHGMALCGNRTIGMFSPRKGLHVYTATSTKPRTLSRPDSGARSNSTKAISSAGARSWKFRKVVLRGNLSVSTRAKPVTVAKQSSITMGGKQVGHVTFVGFSPTLQKAIGLGYVVSSEAKDGNELTLAGDSGTLSAKIVPDPVLRSEGNADPSLNPRTDRAFTSRQFRPRRAPPTTGTPSSARSW